MNFWRVNTGNSAWAYGRRNSDCEEDKMGITGLLPFLKEAQREVNVNSFKGRKVAVDAYCWLHRGAYSCAMQLVMKSEKLESL